VNCALLRFDARIGTLAPQASEAEPGLDHFTIHGRLMTASGTQYDLHHFLDSFLVVSPSL
jgi:hypothetical protein